MRENHLQKTFYGLINKKIKRKPSLYDDKLNLFVDAEPEELELFNGACIMILGVRGKGKSNTVAVMCEEFLRNNVPFCIIDANDEYASLKDYPEFGKYIEIYDATTLTLKNLPRVMYESINCPKPIIIQCTTFNNIELYEILYQMLEVSFKIQSDLRPQCVPYFFITEECHNYVPMHAGATQKSDSMSRLRDLFIRLAKEGRKYGLNGVFISQRPQALNKEVISQSSLMFLHSVTTRWDIDVYKYSLGGLMQPSEVEDTVPYMKKGEVFYIVEDRIDRKQVRLRYTKHIGATPEFSPNRKFRSSLKSENSEKSENQLEGGKR